MQYRKKTTREEIKRKAQIALPARDSSIEDDEAFGSLPGWPG